jgi:hypothetical protein
VINSPRILAVETQGRGDFKVDQSLINWDGSCQYIPSALLAFFLASKLDKPVEEPFWLEGDEE